MNKYVKTALSASLLSGLAFQSFADISFTELPVEDRIGGGYRWMDVSDHGDVVFAKRNSDGILQGFLWNRESGVQLVAPHTFTFVSTSNDGNVQKYGNQIFTNQQVSYTAEPGSSLASLSPDGQKAGLIRNGQEPIELDLASGTETTIPGLPYTNYSITDFSNNNSYALLSSSAVNFPNPNPFFVKQPDGSLLEIDHQYGSISDLSGNGSTVIGRSFFCEVEYACTLISNPAGTFEIAEGSYFPEALNYDGTVAVLSYRDYENNNWKAAIWDSINGVRDLDQLLAAQGIDISGWDQVRMYNISDNGHFIVGEGFNPQGVRTPFLIDATPQCSPNGLL